MVFKNLSPLIKSATEIQYVKREDLKGLLPENPYTLTEKEMIEAYDSSIVVPGMVFLGLDEDVKDGGYSFRNYTGAPVFAVDISPRQGIEKEAEALAEELKGRGYSFVEGMRAMSFPADVGGWFLPETLRFGELWVLTDRF